MPPWLEGTSQAKPGSCLEPQGHTAGQEAASASTQAPGQPTRKQRLPPPSPPSRQDHSHHPEGHTLFSCTVPRSQMLCPALGARTWLCRWILPHHPQTTDQINQVELTSKQTLSRAICDSFLSGPFSSCVTREIQDPDRKTQIGRTFLFLNPKPVQYWDNYGFHGIDYFKLSVI